MLARHGRRLLNLLDDTPIVPGEVRASFEYGDQARQILNDAEEDLRDWRPNLEPIHSSATGMGSNAMPVESSTVDQSTIGEGSVAAHGGVDSPTQVRVTGGEEQHQPRSAQETTQTRYFDDEGNVAQPAQYGHSEAT